VTLGSKPQNSTYLNDMEGFPAELTSAKCLLNVRSTRLTSMGDDSPQIDSNVGYAINSFFVKTNITVTARKVPGFDDVSFERG